MTDTAGTEHVDGRAGGWMRTFTGRNFWPLDPRAAEVSIEDIAHALAHVNRFGGHAREAYSVAQHSVWVAHYVERSNPKLALHALLHDATEAYVGDVVRPIKMALFVAHAAADVPFADVEAEIAIAVLEAFDLPGVSLGHRAIIKHADNVALATEARDLMGDPKWPGLPAPDAERIVPVSAAAAEHAFLAAFARLKGAHR